MPNAMPHALQRLSQTFMTKVTKSFQRSALQPLTQCLRGEGDPWETLPLKNPPLLTALEITTWPTYGFPIVFFSHFRCRSVVLWCRQRCAPTPPTPPPGGGSHRKSTQKRPSKTGTSLGAVLATRATKKEYSGELGSQNDSQMEPKMVPKVMQMRSLVKNMKK